MKYLELREKHQKEYNEFPLGYAFTNEQFDKMMENWGLDPKRDLDKIIGFKSVCGGFIQKKDVEPYRKMVEKINQEMMEALKNDDFFKEACLEEFFNHELCYNHWQGHYDVLTALGFSLKDKRRANEEEYYNNPSSFNLSEHQLDLYQSALIEYYKRVENDI